MQHIIGILGQSNAVGYGNLSQVPVFENNDRMFMFGNDYVMKLAVEPLDSSVGQVDNISNDDVSPKAGFALPMANALLSALPEGDTIILVPCAKKSTSIAMWAKDMDVETLYGSAVKRMWAAYDQAVLSGPAQFSACAIWIGETDAGVANSASQFAKGMSNLIADVRVDLSALNLPFGVARLNDLMAGDPTKPSWNGIRARMQRSFMRNMVVVETEGAEFDSGRIHATTAGYQTIGGRFAEALVNLM